jgi:hypothetical protein
VLPREERVTRSLAFRATLASLVLTAATLAALQSQTSTTPRRILFIGNSLTYSQQGIYTHLQAMGAASTPPLTIQADRAVVGGQYFRTLWERFPEPRQAIARGYDVVVLQEDLPETTVADFRQFARLFVEDVRRTGARPVLLMAWAYKRLGWISMSEIAEAHRAAAKELGVDVAPVGLAWERSAKLRPDLHLFNTDQEHPSIYGTYLATAVVYAAIYATNPTDVSYAPQGVSAEAGAFLRRAAWESVQEYRRQNQSLIQ